MSTILKALQRLEGDKGGGGETGGLREGLVPPGEPLVREGGTRWRAGITALLAALVLGFFLWWMSPTGEIAQPTASSPPAVAAPPELPSEPSAEIVAERPIAPAGRPRISPPSPTVTEPPPLPPIERPAPRVPVAEAAPPSIAVPPAARERATVAPPPRHLTKAPAPRVPVAEAAPPSIAEPPAAERATQPPPRPAAPKAPAPALVATVRPPKVTVEKTIWHPVPERRLARIEVEGRKGALELHEGDAVGTLVVAEIQPSGVVFLHGGERFHRKVGR